MVVQTQQQDKWALDAFLTRRSPRHGVAENYKSARRGRKFGLFTDPGSAK